MGETTGDWIYDFVTGPYYRAFSMNVPADIFVTLLAVISMFLVGVLIGRMNREWILTQLELQDHQELQEPPGIFRTSRTSRTSRTARNLQEPPGTPGMLQAASPATLNSSASPSVPENHAQATSSTTVLPTESKKGPLDFPRAYQRERISKQLELQRQIGEVLEQCEVLELSSLPPTNFLYLSRTNIEKICQLTWNEVPLNPHQCKSMSFKLGRTMQSIEYMVALLDDDSLVCSSVALENFYRVSEKAKQLVEKCCNIDWWQESAFQIQNEEAFKEILLETSFSYNTIRKLLKDINSNTRFVYDDFRFQYSTFDPPSAEEVFKDRVSLQKRLKALVNVGNISSSDIQSQHLGKYLLGRVKFSLHQSNDEDFDVRSFNLWSCGKGPVREWSKESEYLGGTVSKTTWLGVPCAKKLFVDAMQEGEWSVETKILASLNHPNIVKFLCSNKYETIHTQGHFIAMEQMETSLGSFIWRLKEGGSKLSLFPALDVILQIAYGMCYIHEHGIAHRDLKTSNVVVRRINAPQLEGYLEVKIVDFGISKGKLSQHKSNTITRPKIGTTSYMPPEAFSNGRANWFKADVYSFSVMCSVILSGEEPFQNIQRRDLYEAICRGDRPKLPADTPIELASLIMEGWAMDRNSRPSFMDICTRLEELRHHLLRKHSSGLNWKQVDQNYSSGYIQEMLKKRSKAREQEYSHSRLQRAVNLVDEKEWFVGELFDGEETPQQQVYQELVEILDRRQQQLQQLKQQQAGSSKCGNHRNTKTY